MSTESARGAGPATSGPTAGMPPVVAGWNAEFARRLGVR